MQVAWNFVFLVCVSVSVFFSFLFFIILEYDAHAHVYIYIASQFDLFKASSSVNHFVGLFHAKLIPKSCGKVDCQNTHQLKEKKDGIIALIVIAKASSFNPHRWVRQLLSFENGLKKFCVVFMVHCTLQ